MKVLHTIDRVLTFIVNVAIVLIFSVMLALAALQVILREFFSTGILWGDVAARHLVIWVGFFGGFLATRNGKHFHIDVLTRFLKPRARLWFNAISDLFAATVCYFLVRASITFLTVGIDPHSTSFLNIPSYVFALIVPVGFGLVMIQFALKMVESLINALRSGSAEGPGA